MRGQGRVAVIGKTGKTSGSYLDFRKYVFRTQIDARGSLVSLKSMVVAAATIFVQFYLLWTQLSYIHVRQ